MGINKNKKWNKIKKSLAKSYESAKGKWEEIKSEYDEKSQDNHASLESSQMNSARNSLNSKHIKKIKKCPFCGSPIPQELINLYKNQDKIVCEVCGADIP
jgi:DNA repair exonuclease SbcCD ATPase subunit